MSNQIETAFAPLHDTLARMRLLIHLTDEDTNLTAPEEQELSIWLLELTTTAADLAIKAEDAAARTERGCNG